MGTNLFVLYLCALLVRCLWAALNITPGVCRTIDARRGKR